MIIYTILTAVIAVVFIFLEIQPALSLIYFFSAPDNTYYVMPVFFILWLLFLSPSFIYSIVTRLLRNFRKIEPISADCSGISVFRHKAFQSSLVGTPIYIDDKKAGLVDNGKTRFFGLPEGIHTIQAGTGAQSSEKLHINILAKQQLNFEIKILLLGFKLIYDLKQEEK